MNESRLFYDRDTAPLKHFKFLRIMFILSVVFSLVSAVYAGTEGAGSTRVIINYVQAALSLFICIGLFSYMFYGVVLLFVHWALQIGLYAWEIHTDGALMGMSRGEAIAGIAGIAVYMILNLIYFRRRRPLFKPYNGEIPKAVHYAQPGGVPVQTNANWTQVNSGPAESFGYERVQAPVNFVGMSAGAGPATSSAHSEKLKQAYSHFNSGGVARLFPGGIAQADTVVVSLAGLFGIDLAASRYEDYFSLLKAYADIAISREIKGRAWTERSRR